MNRESSCAAETIEPGDVTTSAAREPLRLRAGWADPRPRRNLAVIVTVALLPLSVAIAFAIQQAMGAAAAVTGGCGGG